MQPVAQEINNAAPVPGRDPLAMLKNNEPMPKSGILLHVNIDKNRKAARVFVHKVQWIGKNIQGMCMLDLLRLKNKTPLLFMHYI